MPSPAEAAGKAKTDSSRAPSSAARLASLRIKNLALVDDLTWELTPGFVAVTGETGAGKSVILGALKLLLGERADKTLIRTGAESCTVEGVFQLSPRGVQDCDRQLEELGLEPCEEGQLLIRRSFTASGTNKQFVNGSPATLVALKTIAGGLVDLHGPHDHQSLLLPDKQLALLDAFARAGGARSAYESEWQKLQALRAESEALSGGSMERELDLLRHQVGEIRQADPQPGEDAEVAARYTVAANARRLIELASGVAAELTESEPSILARLGETSRQLRELARLDPTGTAAFQSSHESAVVELEDLARNLGHYAERLDLDPEQLAALEERHTLLQSLKRKYGGTLEAALDFASEAEARLHKLEHRGAELERLEKEQRTCETELRRRGQALSALRQKAAPELSAAVAGQLRDLGFKKSEFDIRLLPLETPGQHGLESVELVFAPQARGFEHVEFLFAPNPGEPAKPLRSIASSGEISRVMLAVKSALADHDAVPLLVFDEIDANVGGEIASRVGARMQSLGRGRQVLCITHLPQVAAQAAAHFAVEKEFVGDRTVSRLRSLEGKAREQELARMLGGANATSLALAREMLQSQNKAT
ncbi:MAG: DNA repair protein RecN [Verrucomicrobia bacterium]|nr:DNA repair protein RecN [Verrucomicrobiota bacterium]